jgi:hypothetical protein
MKRRVCKSLLRSTDIQRAQAPVFRSLADFPPEHRCSLDQPALRAMMRQQFRAAFAQTQPNSNDTPCVAYVCDLSHGARLSKVVLVVHNLTRGVAMTRFFKIASMITMALLDLNSGVSPIFAAGLPLVFGHSETQKTGGRLTKVDAEMRLEEFAKGPSATCTAWTDGCRSCGRNPDGVFCSNVGFACQPSEPRCTRP